MGSKVAGRKIQSFFHALKPANTNEPLNPNARRVLDSLNLGSLLQSLLLLGELHLGLESHDTTAPLLAGLLVLVHETILDGRNELGQLRLVLGANLSQGENSSGLLVYHCSETGLALDNGVWHTHLLAERWQEDNELDRVDVVGDEDKRSLLVLDETNNVVETVLDSVGLLADVLLLLTLLDGGSLLEQTLLLLSLGLRAVLVQELECLGGGVLVQNVLELSERRGNLEAHLEDLLLALKTDVLGPLHHAGDIALGLDVLTDTEVARTLLDEGILRSLLGASLSLGERGRGHLLSGLGGLSLRKEDISKVFKQYSLL
jgi:hypothetical protein